MSFGNCHGPIIRVEKTMAQLVVSDRKKTYTRIRVVPFISHKKQWLN